MKTILITGASTGIGNATANYFAGKGWNVAATMRNPSLVKGLAESDTLKLFKLDVTDQKSIADAVDSVLKTFGTVDVLLNNAGYGSAGPLEAATDEQIKRQFDVNLFGLIDMTRAILPHFKAKKDGLIINISSIGGLVTFPLCSLYHATKWAVEGLTESLQYELNPFGIKLKIVEPGEVKTDFARSLDIFDSSKLPDYKNTMDKVLAFFDPASDHAGNYSSAEQLAEAIFIAATDNSNKFRYVAGDDAVQIWQARQTMQYEDFREMVRGMILG